MARILFVIETASADAVAAVRDATGEEARDIEARVRAGRPAAEFAVFRANHDEMAARIRRLVAALRERGIVPRVYDLEPGERLEDVAALVARELTLQALESMLALYEQGMTPAPSRRDR